MDNISKKCGWDIGIKHLAYCILYKDNFKINIDKWDVIDLTDSSINKKKCCGILKNKKQDNICNKEATFYCEDDINIFYYCKKHISQYSIETKKVEKNI